MFFRAIFVVLILQVAILGTSFSSGELSNGLQFYIWNLGILLWMGMEAFYVRLGQKGGETHGWFSRLFLILSFASLFVSVFEHASGPLFHQAAMNQEAVYLGAGLFVIGFILRVVSIHTLGKFFVTKVQITEDHELVKDGIYKYLRHPSYTGLIAVFSGSAFFLQSFSGILFFVLFALPAYIYRIHVEEQALKQTFGKQYEEYTATSKRIVPYIY